MGTKRLTISQSTWNQNMPLWKTNYFRYWMRRYGTIVWFIFIASLLLIILNYFILKSTNDQAWSGVAEIFYQHFGLYQLSRENLTKYGYIGTVWLLAIRLQALSIVPLIIQHIRVYFFTTPPDPDQDIAELEEGKLSIDQYTLVNNRRPNEIGRPKVHCLCIRLVTKGDQTAHPLIYKAIHAAVTLLSEICDCEHLKVHIVTQTSFITEEKKREWIKKGATEVKEIFVPPEFKTPKRTLYKARNIYYWQETVGVGPECDETRSWILSIDEEVVILRSLFNSFVNDVLISKDQSEIDYAYGTALVDVKGSSIGFLNKVMEARTTAWLYAWITAYGSRISIGTKNFHGSAFFARASAERSLGNDWGPNSSVAEDFATGLAATEKGVRFKYLTGWYVEGSTLNFSSFVIHRSRIMRGQFYNLWYLSASLKQKIAVFSYISVLTLLPLLQLLAFGILCIRPHCFMPAGPQCLMLDFILAITVADQCSIYPFAASYMEMTNLEIAACTLLSPFMFLVGAPFMDAVVVLKTLRSIFDELKTGTPKFEISKKIL